MQDDRYINEKRLEARARRVSQSERVK